MKKNTKRDLVQKGLARRHRKDKLFQITSLSAILLACSFLVLLLGNVVFSGISAFQQTYLMLPVDLTEKAGRNNLSIEERVAQLNVRKRIYQSLETEFPHITKRSDRRALNGLVSSTAIYDLTDQLKKQPELLGHVQRLPILASDTVDMLQKGTINRSEPALERGVSDLYLAAVEQLEDQGYVTTKFNFGLFLNGDSREPEAAGLKGAIMGSAMMIFVTMALAVPIGVAAAIYLEEFAPKNKLTNFIEININNLAAVPSIVFGLLGLAVFLVTFGLPRSAPLVGGMVLALMTLPTVIITTRASLVSVPDTVRQAALGLGASKMQSVFHHVLPAALPGIVTGSIIGLAQALGETAPLLMIGMFAFVVDIPASLTDAATALPVQIYIWSDSPEVAFAERTSAAIMVLLMFIILLNGLAAWLRRRFEIRW